MSPHALENLFIRLGSPAWFWPLVMFILFIVLPLLASYLEQAV
jgi:hypothetical protein